MEVDCMDIEKVNIKIGKVMAELAHIQKAGEQSKSWARIGEQGGINILNHIRDLKQDLNTLIKMASITCPHCKEKILR